jgi:hypothetical protein
VSFADTLRDLARERGIALPDPRHPEPLADLLYPDELALKNAALESFWQHGSLPARPEPVVPAPIPRGYRATSKRRAAFVNNGLSLSLPGAEPIRRGVTPSSLDPAEHLAIYKLLVERLGRPALIPLCRVLNHAIVRGAPGALALVLNVRELDARIVRAAKLLSADLQGAPLGVRAALLYLDPSGSDYYLEARQPSGTLAVKRMFGPDFLELDTGRGRLRFPPTVFSQVNAAMVPTLVDVVEALLAPLDGCNLLDLYCGYGLFSLTVGRRAARVVGMDSAGPAIAAAKGNAAYLRRAEKTRFVAGRVDGPSLARLTVSGGASELAILDPPRQGTAPDVVAALAARRPERVVHICCGTDEIPREIAAWSRAGYRLCRVVPLDLFAGTAGLETALLFERCV